MTNCQSYVDLEGKGRFYCTLSKGEHKDTHIANGFKGHNTKENPAIIWNGQFTGRKEAPK
jgi:hypothetical protein